MLSTLDFRQPSGSWLQLHCGSVPWGLSFGLSSRIVHLHVCYPEHIDGNFPQKHSNIYQQGFEAKSFCGERPAILRKLLPSHVIVSPEFVLRSIAGIDETIGKKNIACFIISDSAILPRNTRNSACCSKGADDLARPLLFGTF